MGRDDQLYGANSITMSKPAHTSINQPSGRAVTQSSYLPWSSGDDFRLSLTPISAGDRGSIPRGRDFFFARTFFEYRLVWFFLAEGSEFHFSLIILPVIMFCFCHRLYLQCRYIMWTRHANWPLL